MIAGMSSYVASRMARCILHVLIYQFLRDGLAAFEAVIILDYLTKHLSGIADHYAVGGYVLGHNCTGTDYRVVTDGHARQNGYVAAYPDAATDCNRFCPFLTRLAFTRVGTMARAVDMHARS